MVGVCVLQERPYICGLCGDTFAQKDDLLTHTASHSNTSIIRPSDTSPPSSAAMVATTKLAAGSASSNASPSEQTLALTSSSRASAAQQTPSGAPTGSSSAAATASASLPRHSSGSPSLALVLQTHPSSSAAVPGASLPEGCQRKRSRSPRHDSSLSPLPQAKRPAFTRSFHADVPRDMSPSLEKAGSCGSSDLSGLPGSMEDLTAVQRLQDQSQQLNTPKIHATSWISSRRPSHNGENTQSDTTSAPAVSRIESRQQGREARGSERSRERRPTICRQEEIEIGDQDLVADDFVDDDDVVFAERVHARSSDCRLKGDEAMSRLALVTRDSDHDLGQSQSISVGVNSSVPIGDSASAAVCEDEKVSQEIVRSACAVAAETCPTEAAALGSVKPFQPVTSKEPPGSLHRDSDTHCPSAFVFRQERKAPELTKVGHGQPIGVAEAGVIHSQVDASQGPAEAAQTFSTCSGSTGTTTASQDLRAASHSGMLTEVGLQTTSSATAPPVRLTHAQLTQPNQPAHPASADRAEAVEQADSATQDELMDSEVQSYFADHVDVDSPSISSAILLNDGNSAAILMNDRDSDDPQLLVCEEEMVESWKDSGSDMEEGGGEGGNLGAKNTEWDEWGSLGVPMQPGENEPDVAPPQAGILNPQRM